MTEDWRKTKYAPLDIWWHRLQLQRVQLLALKALHFYWARVRSLSSLVSNSILTDWVNPVIETWLIDSDFEDSNSRLADAVSVADVDAEGDELLNTFERHWRLLNTIEHSWTPLNAIEHY